MNKNAIQDVCPTCGSTDIARSYNEDSKRGNTEIWDCWCINGHMFQEYYVLSFACQQVIDDNGEMQEIHPYRKTPLLPPPEK